MNTLTERLDNGFAEAWRPKAGDRLIGKIVGLDTRLSTYSEEPYPIVTVEAEDGSTEAGQPIPAGEERAWHCFDTVPRNELRKARPQPGERVGAAFHGKHAERGYNLWRIVVDRPFEAAFDWDSVPADESSSTAEAASTPTDEPAEDDGSIPF